MSIVLLMTFARSCRRFEHSYSDVTELETFSLMATLNPQSNRPLYCNVVIDTLAVDGWAVTYSEEGPGRAAAPPSPLLAVPNVAAYSSTASVPTSYYSTWHYSCFCTLKG